MNPLYNLAIRLYSMAVKLASLRNNKAKLMIAGQSETFDTLARNIEPGKQYIWIHVSSLGEFEQGRPLASC